MGDVSGACERLCAGVRALAHDRARRERAVAAVVADGGGMDAGMAAWALDACVARYEPGALRSAAQGANAQGGAASADGRRVALVLAQSVATAPLRAVVLALARGAMSVRVRPARGQRAFVREVLSALEEVSGERRVVLDDEGDGRGFLRSAVEAHGCDAVHAFGGDESLRSIAGELPGGVALEARGHGFAVSVLDAREAGDEELARLAARDLCAFDGAGCLSSRVLLVAGDAGHEGERLARSLGSALAAPPWPRGPVEVGLATEVLQWQGREAARSRWGQRGKGYSVVLADGPVWVEPPPGARAVAVVPCASDDEVRALLDARARWLTQVGVAEGREREARTRWIPLKSQARVAHLGALQDPPLDGYEDPRPPGVGA